MRCVLGNPWKQGRENADERSAAVSRIRHPDGTGQADRLILDE
jgi:hypothetical protein